MAIRWSRMIKTGLPTLALGACSAVLLLTLSWSSTAQEGTPGPSANRRGGTGKKGPSAPAPRNAQGRVTLGPGPGQKGFWGGGGSIVGRGGGPHPNLPVEDI